jgi:ribosomal protein S18 acetylase RimI-like enzyme
MVTYSEQDNTLTLNKNRSKFMTIQYTISLIESGDMESYINMHQKSWLATYPNRTNKVTKSALKAKLNQQTIEKRIEMVTKRVNSGKMPFLYVLKIEDRVIGMINLKINKKTKTGEVEMLYLDPDYFGNGFGSDLMDFGLDFFKINGCNSALVKVVEYNKRAIKFYLKHGFKLTQKLVDAFDILDDVSLTMYEMRKSL